MADIETSARAAGSGKETACCLSPSRHRFSDEDWEILNRGLEALAAEAGEGSSTGITVVEVESGKEASVGGDIFIPIHSTFKTWVAYACASAVSRGKLSWDEKIHVSRAFLTYAYQPIAETVPPEGRDVTIDELVRWSIIHSDNPSVDLLLRRLGGPAAVKEALDQRGMFDIEIDTDEAGLARFAKEIERYAAAFSKVSNPVGTVREQLLRHPNRGTAAASARGFADLADGTFANSDPEGRILAVHRETVTGAARLHAALKPGWTLAHKTGTGPRIAGVETGINDLGLFTAPDGKRYSVAVFFSGSTLSASALESLIARVGALVINRHESSLERR